MKEPNLELKLSLWIEQDGKLYLGRGLIMILIRIKKLGSLRKAALDLKMSYRAAWGKLKQAEERINKSLVQKLPNKQQYEISKFGEELIENFINFHSEVENFALKKGSEIFGEKIGKDKKRKL